MLGDVFLLNKREDKRFLESKGWMICVLVRFMFYEYLNIIISIIFIYLSICKLIIV